MNLFMRWLFIILIFAFISSDAKANYNLSPIKLFDNWYVLGNSNSLQCHAVSTPNYTRVFHGTRDIPYLMISYIPKYFFTISVYSGFELSKSSPFLIQIGSRSYLLKRNRDYFAYTYNSNDDVRIINDIIKNHDLIKVHSYNLNKQLAIDYYPIEGLLRAMTFMMENCQNLKRVE